MAGQAKSDVKTLDEAEQIKRSKERLAAAKAEQERIDKLIRANQQRTGAKLLGKGPPRKIRRGRFADRKRPSNTAVRTDESKKKTLGGAFKKAADVLSGETARERVRRATE